MLQSSPVFAAPESLRALIEASDQFRFGTSQASARSGARYKEWHHFIVFGQSFRLLINFSLNRASGPRALGVPTASLDGRLIVLLETQTWQGEVIRYPATEIEIRSTDVFARMGDSSLHFEAGAYNLSISAPALSLRAKLKLVPLTTPSLSQHIRLANDRDLSWFILPRLATTGELMIGSQHMSLRGELAYHDHNWGHFSWGEDFAWEWGCALPRRAANPWSAVFVRMANRSRSCVSSQGLFLWNAGGHHRFFRDDELQVSSEGQFEMAEVSKFPPIGSLLAPGNCSDVPKRLIVFARGGGDELLMTLNTRSVSQLVIPDETTTNSVTILNEVSATVNMVGTVKNRNVELEGPGVFEFIRNQ